MINPREKYKQTIRKKKIAYYRYNQKVRVAQHENIGKYDKGRFLETGRIKGKIAEDVYIVQYDRNGKMTRKNGQCFLPLTACGGCGNTIKG